jgi:[acyl-carrier-protein] S-malonyltransferase
MQVISMTTTSPQLGLVFPGQNSQHVGMLAELAAAYPVVLQTFAEASQVLGYDLWQLTQQGPAEQLALTHITQPTMLTSSVAIYRVWQQAGGSMPALVAGHSLGEYSALVCAGVLQFSEAVGLVRQRGEFMQNAVPVGVGSMAAVLGLDDEAVIRCCAEASSVGIVVAANFNSAGQVAIAGETAAVEQAGQLCKAAGAKRVLPMSVSAPFHSPLMKPAAEKFAAVLADIKLTPPSIPVLHNVGLDTTQDVEVIRQKLVAQIYSPVPWVATMHAFADKGIIQLLEIGPGKVLTGLNKRIDERLHTLAVNDVASLQAALGLHQAA